MAWEMSSFDLNEEAEDAEALQAFEDVEEDRGDDYATKEINEVRIQTLQLLL